MTYRFRGHSMSDSGAYRSKDEEAQWSTRDPIHILRDRLIEAGEYTMEEYDALDREVINEIEDEVIPFAESGPEPDVSEVEKYVLAENDPYVQGTVKV